MQKTGVHTSLKKVITFIGISLAAISVLCYQLEYEFTFRLIRLAIPLAFICLIIYHQGFKSHPVIAVFLVLYAISSAFAAWFEHSFMGPTSMITNGVAFLVLALGLLPKLRFRKTGKMMGTMLVVVAVVIGYLLYHLLLMIREQVTDPILFYSMVFMSGSLFLLGIFVFLYNHEYNTKATLVFSFFGIFLIFSETFRGIGYYQLAFSDFSNNFARVLLIISLGILVYYSFLEKNDDEPISNLMFRDLK